MKKILAALLLLFMIVPAFAANTVQTTEQKAKGAQPIILYAEPNDHSQVIAKLTINDTLVPFYENNGWVKVGLSKDGQVGWVNLQQYRQARENVFRSNVQTIFIHKNIVNGKEVVKIDAYKNGQKLSESEAQELYKKMQTENQKQSRDFLNMIKLNQQMEQNMLNTQRIFEDRMINVPVIVFPQLQTKSDKTEVKTKTPEKNN